jgi:hypothetical protein
MYQGSWRRVQKDELYDLYSSPNIIQLIKSRTKSSAGHVAPMGVRSGAYRISVGRPEGKRSLGRPRHRWEDNIKMDFKEVG